MTSNLPSVGSLKALEVGCVWGPINGLIVKLPVFSCADGNVHLRFYECTTPDGTYNGKIIL